MKAQIRRTIASLLVASTLSLSLPAPAAIVSDASAATHRERVELLLIQRGVEPALAAGRAAALTNEEASRMAAEIDALPAGASAGIGALFLLVAYVIAGVVVLAIKGASALGKSAKPPRY
jgi:hypothetical protein